MQSTKGEAEHNESSRDTINGSTGPHHPQNGTVTKSEDKRPKISLRQRLKHFTFAWFLCTMSTGGLSISLAETPHKFRGLHEIGLAIFFLTIILFGLFTSLMILRAIFHPHHMKRVFTHPQESFFIGSFFLSISVLIGGVQIYGISHGPASPWLIDAVYILYWIYAAVSLGNSLMQYYILIARSTTRPVAFTPSMFLPGYSAMLTGTLASLIASWQPPARAYLVVLSGVAYQGYGWLISQICLTFFIRVLLDKGLPPPPLRPALFIPVGSLAYTIVVLIGLANGIPDNHGYFARVGAAKEICRVVALLVSVFMYLFSFWLFALAVLANARRMSFKLTWWAFIFPNVGFLLATNALGRELDSSAILWLASALTIGLVTIWLVCVVGCVNAVWRGDIVSEGKDEDKDL